MNKEHKLDLPTVSTMVREKAIPTLIKLEQNKGCDALFEAVFAARSKFIENETIFVFYFYVYIYKLHIVSSH